MRDSLAHALILLGLRLLSKQGQKRFYEDIVAELRKAGLIQSSNPIIDERDVAAIEGLRRAQFLAEQNGEI